MDHCILLLQHLSTHYMHFIKNGYKRFSKTNSTDPRQRVPLTELDLFPLEVRRVRGDLIETFKILKGLVDIDASSLFTLSQTNNTRGHDMKLLKKG